MKCSLAISDFLEKIPSLSHSVVFLYFFHNPDNYDGLITDLEPDILECKVKWALGSITTNKASEVIEFWLSYFKS